MQFLDILAKFLISSWFLGSFWRIKEKFWGGDVIIFGVFIMAYDARQKFFVWHFDFFYHLMTFNSGSKKWLWSKSPYNWQKCYYFRGEGGEACLPLLKFSPLDGHDNSIFIFLLLLDSGLCLGLFTWCTMIYRHLLLWKGLPLQITFIKKFWKYDRNSAVPFLKKTRKTT